MVLQVPSLALAQRAQVARRVVPLIPPVVGEVVPGTPAARAGFQTGDSVTAIAGTPVRQWTELVDQIQDNAGHAVPIDLRRAGHEMTLAVTPESQPGPEGKPVGKIGIGVRQDVSHRSYSFTQAVAAGFGATLEASTQLVRGIRGMISGDVSRRAISGPIRIGQMAGQSIQLGLNIFLGFLAFISVNLAIVNLLPIPVLDGGQFLFLVAEAAIRRPLSLRLRERLTAVGLVLVVLLMIFAFSNDILSLFGI